MFEKKYILGVGITSASKEDVLEYIVKSLEKVNEKYFIVTPNPEILVFANDDKSYKNILNKAKIALTDGVGIIFAGKLLGKQFKERVTGVDLLENLCFRIAEKPITVGFLGGRPGVAEKTAECLIKKYPGLKVGFVGEEWPNHHFSRLPHVASGQASSINTKYLIHNTIDVLFVAFGAPKQEVWIDENLDKIPVKVAVGVGGAFDYISGEVKRSPVWIQNIGFEWLYRLVRQPWRIKRQFSLLKFIWLVFKERLSKN